MLVSLNWLRDYVDIDIDRDELADRLNLTGTAVEEVKALGEGLENVRVGRLISVEPHPNADKLSVTMVDVGANEPLQIVCGARNIKAGDKVPVAMVGAKLPNGIEIQQAKLRGVTSNGMLCSKTEMKLGGDASGIYILPPEAKVGNLLVDELGLDDTVLELEITPNRPDCLSMIGIAREVGAITDKTYRKPVIDINEGEVPVNSVAKVEIKDADLCPRYTARVIRGVKIGPSPQWMQDRLQKSGVRAINNIVDITNYVMLEVGQPLHAFDLDTLSNRSIIVRRAKQGEIMTTLDGAERQLDPNMLVIADTDRAVALAGVMGGENTEVSEETTDILLESAYFEPTSIMRTSRSLGLLSESSARFEKGIDPNACIFAADRAAQLMAEYAGGTVLKGVIDVYPKTIEPRRLPLRTKRVNSILGTSLAVIDIVDILARLELKCSVSEGTEDMMVSVPTFRPDLEREIDLIEEIARIYGYNNIVSTLPVSGYKQGGLNLDQKIIEMVKARLLASGLSQVITYSFVDPFDINKLQVTESDPMRWFVRLINPLSEEQSVMRTSLLPSLLKVVRHNVNREQYDVQVFEVGHVFWQETDRDLPDEQNMLGMALTGSWADDQWYEKARNADFFDIKGVIEGLMEELRIKDWSVRQFTHPALHPGRSAELLIGERAIGLFGELHPDAQAAFDVPRTYVCELNIGVLVQEADIYGYFSEIAKYPAISLDIAVLVDETVAHATLREIIEAAGKPLLEGVRLFDLYTGKGVPEGKKSLAYSMVFRAADRTLTDDEALGARDKILNELAEKVGAEIRS